MSQYDVILFDLDGTLTESAPGITNSVVYALKKFGIEETDQEKLNKFVGPPLTETYSQYYGFTEEQCQQGVVWFREYYEAKGIFENSVYDGVEEMLKRLHDAGKRIIMATSKPEPMAVRIVEHFGLADYFERIAGSTMDETRTAKADVIAYALEECRITDKAKVLMVGDRRHDIAGAQKNGLDSMGVLYGYGGRAELESAGATLLAKTPGEVADMLLTEV